MFDKSKNILDDEEESRFKLLGQLFSYGQMDDAQLAEFEKLNNKRKSIIENRKLAIEQIVADIKKLNISLKELICAGLEMPAILDIYTKKEVVGTLVDIMDFKEITDEIERRSLPKISNYGPVTISQQDVNKVPKFIVDYNRTKKSIMPHYREGHWVNRNGKEFWRRATIVGANVNNLGLTWKK